MADFSKKYSSHILCSVIRPLKVSHASFFRLSFFKDENVFYVQIYTLNLHIQTSFTISELDMNLSAQKLCPSVKKVSTATPALATVTGFQYLRQFLLERQIWKI